METKKQVNRRPRRTKKALEEAIWGGLERLIIRDGVHGVGIVKLAQEAGVEPPVLYNRFRDMNDILKQYVLKHDFWLDTKPTLDEKLGAKGNMKQILAQLVENVYANEVMQRILLWEISDTHEITREIASKRDGENKFLLEHFNRVLGKSTLDFNATIAIIIAGVYYLVLHRKISNFADVNFNTPQGKQLLITTIDKMIDLLYPDEKN